MPWSAYTLKEIGKCYFHAVQLSANEQSSVITRACIRECVCDTKEKTSRECRRDKFRTDGAAERLRSSSTLLESD